jgi:hypothetical protein
MHNCKLFVFLKTFGFLNLEYFKRFNFEINRMFDISELFIFCLFVLAIRIKHTLEANVLG